MKKIQVKAYPEMMLQILRVSNINWSKFNHKVDFLTIRFKLFFFWTPTETPIVKPEKKLECWGLRGWGIKLIYLKAFGYDK